MPKKQNWMPVFVVVPAAITMHAAHPKHRGKIPKGPQVDGADFEQRVGTAMRRSDGSFSVQLIAMPINGKLLIRPARRGEYCNPTVKEY